MRIKRSAKLLSVILAVCLLACAGMTQFSAASWNGTNYGGGTSYGYRTFLDAFGIDYDTYMNWMDSHDDDNYYLGTPYVGYDHRNPHGDCQGALGYYDTPGVEGLNCTGFVWHVLYKAASLSGASRSQINSLPVMGAVPSTWANLGVYRIYFNTKEEALASGVLEKGDLLWIYGTKDNHNAIFYGDNPHHDKFWHSAGRNNNMATIRSAGTFLGMCVAKVTMPNKLELHVNLSKKNSSVSDDSQFGAKYCVFNSKANALAAAASNTDSSAWDSRLGTIVTDSKGYGCFRTEGAPTNNQLKINGVLQKNLSYFSSQPKKMDSSYTYYAVQYKSPEGEQRDRTVYEFTDSGKRSSIGYKQYNIKPVRKLETPRLSSLTSTENGVKLRWNPVKGAEQYRVYYKNSKGGWTKFGQTSGTEFTDELVSVGSTYTYTIRCVDSDGDFESSYDSKGWQHTYTGIEIPQFSRIESTANGVKLSWNAVRGADSYRVYYRNRNGGWTKMAQTSTTSYTDEIVSVGTEYTYTVRCLNKAGRFCSDYNHSGTKYTYSGIEAPVITSGESLSNGVKISWNAVKGAHSYRVYYLGKNSWKRLGETTGTSFTDEIVTAGTSYTYTVRCLNKAGRLCSGYNRDGWEFTYEGVEAPVITKAERAASGVKISWKAVNGAEGYRVFCKTTDGWKRLGDTSSPTFTDNSLPSGQSRTYTVRCFGAYNNYISGYDRNGYLFEG